MIFGTLGVWFSGRATTVRAMSELGAQLEISATDSGWILTGEIDAHTAPLLAAAMTDLPPGVVTVDVAGVSFMDSSGLRVLDRGGHQSTRRGWRSLDRAPHFRHHPVGRDQWSRRATALGRLIGLMADGGQVLRLNTEYPPGPTRQAAMIRMIPNRIWPCTS